jgi:hypothetical protein
MIFMMNEDKYNFKYNLLFGYIILYYSVIIIVIRLIAPKNEVLCLKYVVKVAEQRNVCRKIDPMKFQKVAEQRNIDIFYLNITNYITLLCNFEIERLFFFYTPKEQRS